MTPKEATTARFRQLCDQVGGVEVVATATGLSLESLKQVLAGTKLPSGRPRGLGPASLEAIASAFPDWVDPPLVEGVAQSLRLSSYSVPITFQWEQLLQSEKLPATFTVAMPDEALSPRIARGTELIFSTTATPAPGKGVLVQDSNGKRYVRRYGEGLAGAWMAQAVNDAYVSLDSARDGLTLLAVMTGRLTGDI